MMTTWVVLGPFSAFSSEYSVWNDFSNLNGIAVGFGVLEDMMLLTDPIMKVTFNVYP